MASCDLKIELEPGRPAWTLGGVVRGEVVVRTDDDVRCDGLEVRSMWATHGKGNRDEGGVNRQRIFTGEWRGGVEQRHPFELLLPTHGPVAYHGEVLSVGWFVRATADVPWASDPSDEVEIPVAPDPSVEPDWKAQFESEGRIPLRSEDGGKKRERGVPLTREPGETSPAGEKFLQAVWSIGCLGMIGFLLYQAGLFLWTMWSGLREALRGGSWLEAVDEVALLGAVVLFFAGIVAAITWLVLRKRRLGDVELSIEPRIVAPGETVRVAVSGRPRIGLELDRAVIILHGRESATRGSGTSQRTFRHVLHEETIEVAASRRLAANLPFRLEGEVSIPAVAAPSFAASSNSIRWSVGAKLDLARCPDWFGDGNLVVTVVR